MFGLREWEDGKLVESSIFSQSTKMFYSQIGKKTEEKTKTKYSN